MVRKLIMRSMGLRSMVVVSFFMVLCVFLFVAIALPQHGHAITSMR